MSGFTGNELIDERLDENLRISEILHPLRDEWQLRRVLLDYGHYIHFMEQSMRDHASFLRGHDQLSAASRAQSKSVAHDQERFSGAYPERFRSATLSQLFSIVENEYHQICNVVQKIFEIDLAATDLADRGISRARKYIKKVSGIDDWDKEAWELLLVYQEIRNAKVHRKGKVINHLTRIAKIPGAELGAENGLHLNEKFLPAFIHFISHHLPTLKLMVIHTINTRFFKDIPYLR